MFVLDYILMVVWMPFGILQFYRVLCFWLWIWLWYASFSDWYLHFVICVLIIWSCLVILFVVCTNNNIRRLILIIWIKQYIINAWYVSFSRISFSLWFWYILKNISLHNSWISICVYMRFSFMVFWFYIYSLAGIDLIYFLVHGDWRGFLDILLGYTLVSIW